AAGFTAHPVAPARSDVPTVARESAPIPAGWTDGVRRLVDRLCAQATLAMSDTKGSVMTAAATSPLAGPSARYRNLRWGDRSAAARAIRRRRAGGGEKRDRCSAGADRHRRRGGKSTAFGERAATPRRGAGFLSRSDDG